MLVLAPAACCLAGIGTDALLRLCLASLKAKDSETLAVTEDRNVKRRPSKGPKPSKVLFWTESFSLIGFDCRRRPTILY